MTGARPIDGCVEQHDLRRWPSSARADGQHLLLAAERRAATSCVRRSARPRKSHGALQVAARAVAWKPKKRGRRR
jgi:hypothetical protein